MPDANPVVTTYIPHLKNQFARGAAVLFTGAGFSVDGVNTSGEPIPSASQLTQLLWNLCYPSEPFDQTTKLQDIYDAALQSRRRDLDVLMRHLFTVDPARCPSFYADILQMPWARIYTLNVDDLTEKILSEQSSGRPVRTVSAISGSLTDIRETDLSIVHLNGSLDDIPDKVTFGRSQYARRRTPDAFYDLLRHDLTSRPVVFIGSTLEENSLWQHLELRGDPPSRNEREMRPRSYLVTRSLNRGKLALLSRYNVEWLNLKGKDFSDEFLSQMSDERVRGNELLCRRSADAGRAGPRIVRIQDLPAPRAEPTEYLLGAEPEWSDAQQKRIAHRLCFDDLVTTVRNISSVASERQFLVVTGTAGTGKSSAMMSTALQLEATGTTTGWISAVDRYDAPAFRSLVARNPDVRALFIGDADLWERRLSRAVRDALDINPRLAIVCECRSTKVERIVSPEELNGIQPIEFVIPYLEDSDIDTILEVLERENRLGALRGQSQDARRRIFRAEAGRQLLVAMFKVTHGTDFKDKAVQELNELEVTRRAVYGLVSVAHAHRAFITKDEIAIAFGDDIEMWPRALDELLRRKLVLVGTDDSFRARHREIAQFVYDEMNRQGTISEVIRALLKIGGTKCSINTNRLSRSGRLLATFVSHRLMKRTVGISVGRQIYSEFENLLAWDYHYWLHRGALELEDNHLAAAENFLNQAKAIEPNDIFIDNELAYLAFRKANEAPHSLESTDLVTEAIAAFERIAFVRPDQRPTVYHIMGRQGLLWCRKAPMSHNEKRDFLGKLHRNVLTVLSEDIDEMLESLERELRRELLLLAT